MASHGWTLLRRALRSLPVAAWPASCAACGAPLPAAAVRGVCPACWVSPPPVVPPACPTCALPLPRGERCPDCSGRARGALPDGAAAAWLYGGRTVRLHRLLKFQGDLRLAGPLAERMARAHLLAGLPPPDLVVPVPPDPSRSRGRGRVPSLLARHVAGRLGRPLLPGALRKVRPTPSQATAPGRAERETNLRGAFHAREEAVRGRSILVVDDVATTGSTLREAVRALRAGRAALVATLVLARTPRRVPAFPARSRGADRARAG